MTARLALVVVLACATAWAETATVTCKDGTSSKGGRGACRGHGGIDKTKAAGGDAGTAAAPAAAATPAPAAASVTCKDGTPSKGGRGACRGHGGVDKTKAAGGDTGTAAAPATAPSAPAAAPPAVAKPQPSAAPAPTPRAAAPAPTRTASAARGKSANDDPTGALAKCRDGTYWHGTKHSGSCSHHGGVDSWLDGTQRN